MCPLDGQFERNPLAQEARDALGEWLQTFEWDCFGTFTFRDLALGRPQLAIDRAKRIVEHHGARAAFIAAEPHKLAGMHAHGLIAWWPRHRVNKTEHRDEAKILSIKRNLETKHHWERAMGFGSFSVPEGPAAAFYVAKYVLKDRVGEWGIYGKPVALMP